MKTKICTSIEQSKKLLELGLSPVDTADFIYSCIGHNLEILNYPEHWRERHWKSQIDAGTIPAWSLSALLELMPNSSLHRITDGWRCDSFKSNGYILHYGETKDNLLDAAFEQVLWLIEEGVIKTEKK